MKKYLPILIIIAGIYLFASPTQADAAVLCWKGTTSDWTVASNWVTAAGAASGAAPGASDVATFDSGASCTNAGSGTAAATILAGAAISVQGIDIKSTYSGTITQTTTATITVGSSGWTQVAGTFTGGSGAIIIGNSGGTGDLSITGGSFTSTSGTLTALNNVTITGTFTHNSGTVNIFSCNGCTKTYNISATLNNLDIGTNTNGMGDSFTFSTNNPIVNGTLRLLAQDPGNGCSINGPATIIANGNVSAVGLGCGSNGTGVIIINGTANQTLAGEADTNTFVPSITINKASGNLTITNEILVQGDWTYTSMGTGSLIVTGSTIRFYLPNGGSYTITGSHTLNNVGFDSGPNGVTSTIASGTTLTVSGNLVFSNTTNGCSVNGPGTIQLQGNLTTGATLGCGGSVPITFTGSGNQTVNIGGGSPPLPSGTVTLNKSGGTITLATAWALTTSGQNLLVQAGSSQTITGAFNLTVNSVFTISGTLTQGTTTFINGSGGSFMLTKSGVWNNTSTGKIQVDSGGVTNNGTMNFNLQNTCGSVANGNISITSTSAGVARNWDGIGYYNFYNITVQDQNESPQRRAITAWSSTATSNTNWLFRSDCPKPPTAYWKFDEGTGTTANDSTSNAATGTLGGVSGTATGSQTSTTLQDTSKTWTVNGLTGAMITLTGGTGSGQKAVIISNTSNTATIASTWTTTPVAASTTYTISPSWQTEDQCISGKCLFFDGSTSKVTAATVVKSVQSVGLWVRPNTLNATNVLIDLDGGTHKITSNASGTITATGFSTPSIYVNGILNGTITLNRWNFVEVTTATAFDTTSSFTIGTDGTNYTKGFFDEVRLFSYARTASQVGSDYNARGAISGASAQVSNAINNNHKALSDGLIGYWKQDETSWNGTAGEAKDASGNANDGTFNGAKNGDANTTSVAATSGGANTISKSTASWTVNGFTNFTVTINSGTGSGQSRTILSNTATQITTTSNWTTNPDAISVFTISDMAPGKFGNGGVFNGVNNYVTVTDNASLNSASGTVSTWVKTTNDTDEQVIRVVDGGGFVYFGIELGGSASSCVNGLIAVFRQGGATEQVAYSTANRNELFDGNWHHMVITANGTSTKIYLDGVSKPVSNCAGSDSGGFTSGAGVGQIIRIGAHHSAGNYFSGTMDDYRVYNRALSGADVNNLYNFAPGPVGKWDFEEGKYNGTSGEVKDTSGNGYNGTFGGSNLSVVSVPGKVGKATKYNGTDNYVSIGNARVSGLSAVTVEAWYKRRAANAKVLLGEQSCSIGTVPGSALSLEAWTDSTIFFTVGNAAVTCASGGIETAKFTDANDTNWHHVAYTFDGTQSTNATKVQGYYDGVKQSLNFGTSTFGSVVNNADTTFRLGDCGNCSDGITDGQIDQVRIYNYARTQKQVIEDMNAGHPAPGSPIGTPYGYWKFNEGANDTCSGGVNDACNSGNGGSTLDGAQTNMAVPATTTSGWTQNGKFGKALIFDGTDDRVDVGDLTGTETATQITWSMWLNPTSLATGRCIFCKVKTPNGTPTQASWALMTDGSDSSMLRAIVTSSNGAVSTYGQSPTGVLTNSSWVHVAVVYDGSQASNTDRIKMYFNGINKSVSTTGTIPTTGPAASTSNGVFGTDSVPGTAGTFFTGTIDEPKVYLGVLTADQVLVDMNGGQSQSLGIVSDKSTFQLGADNQEYCVPGDTNSCAAPVARWDFEEKKGDTIYDTSGNGYTGDLDGGNVCPGFTSCPTWVNGKTGGALKFVSSLSQSVTGPTDITQLHGLSKMTMEAWLKRTATSNNVYVSRLDTGLHNGYFLDFESGNALFGLQNATDTCGQVASNDTNWHHLVMVFDGTLSGNANRLKGYIDGVQQTLTFNGACPTNAPATTDSATTDTLMFGKDGFGANYSDGSIDQVRLFDYARTPTHVAWDYNKGGPVAEWKMDECAGSSLKDSSGNSYTGTLTVGSGGSQTSTTDMGTCSTNAATPWYNGRTGKVNSSINLDGTDDFITTAAFSPLATAALTTTKASWGGWFYPTHASTAEALIDKPSEFHLTKNSSDQILCGFGSIGAGNDGANVTITLNAWNNIFCTYDGANVKTYINGILKDTTAKSANITATSSILYLGEKNDATIRYQGQIDEVKIYNYDLTLSQVKSLYNNGSVYYGPSTGSP